MEFSVEICVLPSPKSGSALPGVKLFGRLRGLRVQWGWDTSTSSGHAASLCVFTGGLATTYA